MKSYIVVLRGRTNVMRFASSMRYNGYYAKVKSLPKEIKLGCGLCVEINPADVSLVPKVVSYYKIESFYGVYTLYKSGQKYFADRVYP